MHNLCTKSRTASECTTAQVRDVTFEQGKREYYEIVTDPKLLDLARKKYAEFLPRTEYHLSGKD